MSTAALQISAFAVCLTMTAAAQPRQRVPDRPSDPSMVRPDGTPMYPQENIDSSQWPLTEFEKRVNDLRRAMPPFPKPQREEPGIVSLAELQNPLSADEAGRLESAARKLREGDTEEGLRKLNEAVKNPATKPYALAMLGTEHLRRQQVQLAIADLAAAAQFLPGSAAVRSNLAYALWLSGSAPQAEREIRQAHALEPGDPRMRLLLGLILLDNPEAQEEAREQLLATQHLFRGAHVGLAILDARAGDVNGMREHIRLGAGNPDEIPALEKEVLMIAQSSMPGTEE